MDAHNPAVAAQTALSPADLARVAENPKMLTDTARKMLLINMSAMHARMRDPNTPVGQRQSWMDFLAKLGDVYPKASAQVVPGAGFSVNIVLGNNQSTQTKFTANIDAVESEVKEVQDKQFTETMDSLQASLQKLTPPDNSTPSSTPAAPAPGNAEFEVADE